MKHIYKLLFAFVAVSLLSSCLKAGYDDVANSSEKDMTSVDYTYRFTYDDIIQEGTANEEVQKNRVCEVVFKKAVETSEENGIKVYTVKISHDVNSVQKAGPQGKVTKAQLYEMFKEKIAQDGLSKLWVYVNISEAAIVKPLDGAPTLGKPGDYTQDRMYRVTAADGSYQDYIIRTVKSF